jgi:penicillin-binding protein A
MRSDWGRFLLRAFAWTVIVVGLSATTSLAGSKRHTHTAVSSHARARFSQFSKTPAKVRTSSIPQASDIRVVSALELEPASLALSRPGELKLEQIPGFHTQLLDHLAGITRSRDIVVYSLDPSLQSYSTNLIRNSLTQHAAIVVMEPGSGKIRVMAEKSALLDHPALHNGFPAASIFKLVTTATALEVRAIGPDTVIRFRGGNYTLNEWNYKPDDRKDRRRMPVSEALGKSCNPVFGRIGLTLLSPNLLRAGAEAFGFNSQLKSELPVAASSATIPEDDLDLSLTSAGFGQVTLSPLHAAALMAGIAQDGVMPRPILIDRVVSSSGSIVYQSRPENLRRMLSADTAHSLLEMMESTTTMGTSRREFMYRNRPVIGGIRVAAKTGTLSGENPKGVNNWFVAAAPLDHPQIVVAVVVVNSGRASSRASHLGRMVLERFFQRSNRA